MPITLYRKDKQLTGKELSANTIASFLVAQNASVVPDLTVGAVMPVNLLQFLNRSKALQHWQEKGWLSRAGVGLSLTESGLNEIAERESGTSVERKRQLM